MRLERHIWCEACSFSADIKAHLFYTSMIHLYSPSRWVTKTRHPTAPAQGSLHSLKGLPTLGSDMYSGFTVTVFGGWILKLELTTRRLWPDFKKTTFMMLVCVIYLWMLNYFPKLRCKSYTLLFKTTLLVSFCFCASSHQLQHQAFLVLKENQALMDQLEAQDVKAKANLSRHHSEGTNFRTPYHS